MQSPAHKPLKCVTLQGSNMTHIVITDSETTHTLPCSAAQGFEFHMYSVA